MKTELLKLIDSLYVLVKQAKFEGDDGHTFIQDKRQIQNRIYSIERLIKQLPD